MSLPSLIFVAVWGSMKLAELKIISETAAVISFLLIIGNVLFLMVYYAYKRKN